MFDTFGEFDSYAEINMAAEGLREEGDTEGIRKLAAENGLGGWAEAYINGETDELCSAVTAAIGKLEIEKKEAGGWMPLAEDVADYLEGHCDDPAFAAAVRRKGKRITEAVREIEKEAEKNKITMPGGACCSYCGPMKGYRLIKDYYQKGVQ